MNVVHVVTAFPRCPDDPITPWLVRLLQEQKRRGLDIEVLAPAYQGLASGDLEGITVHRFRYAPARWEVLSHDQTVPDRLREFPLYAALLPFYLVGGLWAAWRLGHRRPDVVHVHWPLPHAFFGAALRTASGARTAMVCSYYSVELSWVEHGLRWLRPMLRWSARTADQVTAISSSTAERLRPLARDSVRVIPFSAAVDGHPSGDGVLSPSPRLPLEGEEIQLLFVGRLVERKGVEVLVRALSELLRERPARLTVVGEGSWEKKIRETVSLCGVETRVHFTGYVTQEQLGRLYQECDVFVLPAVVDSKGDTEGLGVVLLEALRFARPVVASAVGGIPDIVEPGRSGWLVPPGDPGALARAILEVAANPLEARRVAEAGRRRVEEQFSWDKITNRLLECYRVAIDRRRTRGT